MELTALHVPRGHHAREYPICIDWPVPSRAAITEWGDEAMDIWQNDRCAFCGHGNGGGRLYRDHDHDTGLMRGLLCPSCNVQEASCWYYESWIAYASFANPAHILGIEEWYKQPPMIRDGDNVRPYPGFEHMFETLHWDAPSLVPANYVPGPHAGRPRDIW